MYRLLRITFLFIAVIAAFCGCANDRNDRDDAINRLWRQGYGFNNPNAQRMRQGLPVQNFDGSVDRQ